MKRMLLNGLALALICLAASAAEQPKDFTVTAPGDGSKFVLSKSKAKYVAVHFLLKTECPVCLAFTQSITERAQELPQVEHIFLKPDEAKEIKAWTKKVKGENVPVIYQDEGAKLAKAFGIPDGYEFHGEKVHFPALVLLSRDGKELFRYVGKSNADRFGWPKFKAKVAELGLE